MLQGQQPPHSGLQNGNGNTKGPYHRQNGTTAETKQAADDYDDDFSDWDEEDPLRNTDDMSSDLRPPYRRPSDGQSYDPLMKSNGVNDHLEGLDRPPLAKRKSGFREGASDAEAQKEMRKRYTYAAFFLAVSLVSFTIQTETAVYIKKYLGWKKSYAMLYVHIFHNFVSTIISS